MSLLDQTIKFLDFLRAESANPDRQNEVFSKILIEYFEISPDRISELEEVAQHMRDSTCGMYAAGNYTMFEAVGMGIAVTLLIGARLQKDNRIL